MNKQSNKITALYCRIAYYFTDADKSSGERQMKTLLQYATDHHLENPHFYCDWGASGISTNRPEYQRMLQDVLAGTVSNLVVLNLSRLSCDITTCWELVCTVLPQHGVVFHSVQDGCGIAESLNELARIQNELLRAYRLSQKGAQK